MKEFYNDEYKQKLFQEVKEQYSYVHLTDKYFSWLFETIYQICLERCDGLELKGFQDSVYNLLEQKIKEIIIDDMTKRDTYRIVHQYINKLLSASMRNKMRALTNFFEYLDYDFDYIRLLEENEMFFNFMKKYTKNKTYSENEIISSLISAYQMVKETEDVSELEHFVNKNLIIDYESTDLLTREEEIKLGYEILQGNKQARKRMILSNQRLVKKIANYYINRAGETILRFEDLESEGNIGLLRAIDRFDITKGYKFSTYASWWIKQNIQRAIGNQARTIRIPVHMVETLSKLARIQQRLTLELNRDPTPKELAIEMDMTEDQINKILKYAEKPTSLNLAVGNDKEDTTLEDMIEDQTHVKTDNEAIDAIFKQELLNEILNSDLQEREKKIICTRYGLEDGRFKTLEETAKICGGVSRERVRQVEAKALKKLKNKKFFKSLNPKNNFQNKQNLKDSSSIVVSKNHQEIEKKSRANLLKYFEKTQEEMQEIVLELPQKDIEFLQLVYGKEYDQEAKNEVLKNNNSKLCNVYRKINNTIQGTSQKSRANLLKYFEKTQEEMQEIVSELPQKDIEFLQSLYGKEYDQSVKKEVLTVNSSKIYRVYRKINNIIYEIPKKEDTKTTKADQSIVVSKKQQEIGNSEEKKSRVNLLKYFGKTKEEMQEIVSGLPQKDIEFLQSVYGKEYDQETQRGILTDEESKFKNIYRKINNIIQGTSQKSRVNLLKYFGKTQEEMQEIVSKLPQKDIEFLQSLYGKEYDQEAKNEVLTNNNSKLFNIYKKINNRIEGPSRKSRINLLKYFRKTKEEMKEIVSKLPQKDIEFLQSVYGKEYDQEAQRGVLTNNDSKFFNIYRKINNIIEGPSKKSRANLLKYFGKTKEEMKEIVSKLPQKDIEFLQSVYGKEYDQEAQRGILTDEESKFTNIYRKINNIIEGPSKKSRANLLKYFGKTKEEMKEIVSKLPQKDIEFLQLVYGKEYDQEAKRGILTDGASKLTNIYRKINNRIYEIPKKEDTKTTKADQSIAVSKKQQEIGNSKEKKSRVNLLKYFGKTKEEMKEIVSKLPQKDIEFLQSLYGKEYDQEAQRGILTDGASKLTNIYRKINNRIYEIPKKEDSKTTKADQSIAVSKKQQEIGNSKEKKSRVNLLKYFGKTKEEMKEIVSELPQKDIEFLQSLYGKEYDQSVKKEVLTDIQITLRNVYRKINNIIEGSSRKYRTNLLKYFGKTKEEMKEIVSELPQKDIEFLQSLYGKEYDQSVKKEVLTDIQITLSNVYRRINSIIQGTFRKSRVNLLDYFEKTKEEMKEIVLELPQKDIELLQSLYGKEYDQDAKSTVLAENKGILSNVYRKINSIIQGTFNKSRANLLKYFGKTKEEMKEIVSKLPQKDIKLLQSVYGKEYDQDAKVSTLTENKSKLYNVYNKINHIMQGTFRKFRINLLKYFGKPTEEMQEIVSKLPQSDIEFLQSLYGKEYDQNVKAGALAENKSKLYNVYNKINNIIQGTFKKSRANLLKYFEKTKEEMKEIVSKLPQRDIKLLQLLYGKEYDQEAKMEVLTENSSKLYNVYNKINHIIINGTSRKSRTNFLKYFGKTKEEMKEIVSQLPQKDIEFLQLVYGKEYDQEAKREVLVDNQGTLYNIYKKINHIMQGTFRKFRTDLLKYFEKTKEEMQEIVLELPQKDIEFLQLVYGKEYDQEAKMEVLTENSNKLYNIYKKINSIIKGISKKSRVNFLEYFEKTKEEMQEIVSQLPEKDIELLQSLYGKEYDQEIKREILTDNQITLNNIYKKINNIIEGSSRKFRVNLLNYFGKTKEEMQEIVFELPQKDIELLQSVYGKEYDQDENSIVLTGNRDKLSNVYRKINNIIEGSSKKSRVNLLKYFGKTKEEMREIVSQLSQENINYLQLLYGKEYDQDMQRGSLDDSGNKIAHIYKKINNIIQGTSKKSRVNLLKYFGKTKEEMKKIVSKLPQRDIEFLQSLYGKEYDQDVQRGSLTAVAGTLSNVYNKINNIIEGTSKKSRENLLKYFGKTKEEMKEIVSKLPEKDIELLQSLYGKEYDQEIKREVLIDNRGKISNIYRKINNIVYENKKPINTQPKTQLETNRSLSTHEILEKQSPDIQQDTKLQKEDYYKLVEFLNQPKLKEMSIEECLILILTSDCFEKKISIQAISDILQIEPSKVLEIIKKQLLTINDKLSHLTDTKIEQIEKDSTFIQKKKK